MRITRTVFPKYWVKSWIWTKVYKRQITLTFDNVPAWHLQKPVFNYLSHNFKMENIMKGLVNSSLFYVRVIRVNKGSHLSKTKETENWLVCIVLEKFQYLCVVSCTGLKGLTNISSWGCLRQAYERSSCNGSNNRLSVVV